MVPLSAPARVPTCLPIALDIPEHRHMLRKPHNQPQCHRGEGSLPNLDPLDQSSRLGWCPPLARAVHGSIPWTSVDTAHDIPHG